MRSSKRKATGATASGAASASDRDIPGIEPEPDQPVGGLVDEATPGSSRIPESLDLPAAGLEAVGDSCGQAGEAAPPSVEV